MQTDVLLITVKTTWVTVSGPKTLQKELIALKQTVMAWIGSTKTLHLGNSSPSSNVLVFGLFPKSLHSLIPK